MIEAVPVQAQHLLPEAPIETIGSLVDRFVDYMRDVRQLSEHTIRGYRSELDRLARWLWANHREAVGDPSKIEHRMLRGYMVYRAESGIANATVQTVISTLKSFMKYLARTERITDSPASLLRCKRQPRPLPRWLEHEEATALVTAPLGYEFKALRAKAILEVLYSAGLRSGELVAVNDSDVDWTAGTIRVRGKGKRMRLAILGAPALAALRLYREARGVRYGRRADGAGTFVSEHQPGRRMSTKAVRAIVKKSGRSAGIAGNIKTHAVRHTFATHLLQGGANIREVQELLGHKSVDTTAIYAHVTIADLRKVYARCHPRR